VRGTSLAVCLVGFVGLLGCGAPIAPSPEAAPPTRAPAKVTLLYTSDEHGWLASTEDKGKRLGGAALFLHRLTTREGHCPRPMPAWSAPAGLPTPPAATPLPSPADCDDTLLLSGGDNWTGPAITSFYDGQPMALAMARLGYAASAFGNHELDFGADRFVAQTAIEGFPYLSANLRSTTTTRSLGLQASATFVRNGARITVVGATTETLFTVARAQSFEGFAITPMEPAVDLAVADAWKSGADAVVLLVHECPPELRAMLERHPEWNLSFVGAGHCHRRIVDHVGSVPLVAPDWRLRAYARLELAFDFTKSPGKRATSGAVALRDVEAPVAAELPLDDELVRLETTYQRAVARDLGDTIGFCEHGFKHRSAALGELVTRAWREELGVDLALVNEGGLRQAIPAGPVTLSSIYSVLPFENRIIVMHLSGKDLIAELEGQPVFLSGLARDADGTWRDAGGKPIEAARSYSVATIDFLYFGGSGFRFQARDPKAIDTGTDWREPVIRWIRAQKTSPSAPLDR
jgi:5'-nucleotidase/UDP-sugar diphosphatase